MIAVLPKSAACCGCGACRAACPVDAIEMKPDKEGFHHPVVDKAKCVNCGKCAAVCPVLHPGSKREPLAVYAAKAKDDELRRGSASGGVFTVLAQATLARGGVVFGAGFDHRDWRVIHKAARNEEELDDLRGSKYVQSDMGDTYAEAKRELDAGCEVLFSGCPCQIAALRRFLGRDYPNLLTVDLICHGVPSPLAWRKYLDDRERETKGKITRILARRYCAWREYAISLAFDNANEIAYSNDVTQDLFMRGFLGYFFLRECCHKCPFRGFKGCSDITIGDYFRIANEIQGFDDDHGVSAILINSERGNLCLGNERVKFEMHKIPIEAAVRDNPPIIYSPKPSRLRREFLNRIPYETYDSLIKQLLSRRSGSLFMHTLWWLKRLVVNGELNRYSLR